jgi:hypothetical protein
MKDGSSQELKGAHRGRVFKLAFNAVRIVSAGQDNRIVIWDFSRPIAPDCSDRSIDARFFE